MKHILCTLALLGSVFASAQTIVYHENFETPDSVVATGNPAWNSDATLQVSGTKSHRNTVAASDTSWLTTTAFNTTGNSFVILNFKQICKIEFFDFTRIEVSNDNGVTWTMLTGTEYQGTSPFGAQGNKFTAASYATWLAANNAAVPNNTWWMSEQFDVSALIGNAAQAKVRFKLYDGNANGANGNYGWNIDDVIVTASASELVPPTITLLPPNLIGTVFNLGPYTINADIQDGSGIATAELNYTVNSGPNQMVTMTNVSGNQWQGVIPAVTDSDTVCFWIHAVDASPAANTANYPTSGCQQFVALSGIVFPYIENFDGSSASLWTVHDSMPGSPATTWQLGTPAYGATNSAHSAPNAFDINLTTAYGDQAYTYLISPVFDFTSAVNAKLSFWHNYNAEQGWDGVRVEYTTDGSTWNVLGVQNDPLGTNWYTNSALNSSGLPGWDGNSQGWIQSEYELSLLNNAVGPVQFRFVFTSDFSVTVDGYSIDDFAIVLPSPQDAGVRTMLAPDVSSCLPTGSVPLTVVWKNFGTQNVVGPMNIAYKIDNNTPVVEQYNGTLIPAALDTFTFATPMVLTAGTHTMKVYTDLTNDGLNMNDSITVSFTAVNGVTVPYYNGLNTAAAFNDFCATNTAQGRVQVLAAAANTGAMGMAFDATNSIGWNIFTDTLTASPYYVWNPTVNPQQRANARLVVDATGYTSLVLEFDAKLLYSFANEYTNFRVKVNGQQITPHMMPNNGNSTYDTYRFMLDSFLPSTYLTIDFESKVAFDFAATGSGIFVDNVNIYQPDPFDAGVTAVLTPASSTSANTNATVSVRIRNFGSNTLTSIPVSYAVNAGTPVTGTWTGSLAPNAQTTYTFATPFSSPTGQYDLCAWTSLNNDVRVQNDTTCTQLIGVPIVAAPYFEDFEGTSAQYWAVQSSTPNTWQLGNPSPQFITGTVSGTNAWEVNLNGTYDNNAYEILYTPFIDFSQVTNAELRFWNWWYAEPSWDGGRIEITTDGGATWSTLGTMGDPNGTDWYNTASLISSGQPAWQGTGAQYVHSMLKLPALDNFPTPVRFRFIFTSDASVNNYDGWAVDDFEIFVPINDSVTKIMVNSNQSSPMPLPGSNSISFNMTNIGALPLTTIKATVEVDGTPYSTDNITFTPTFQPGQTRSYTFTTPWNGVPGDHQFRVWTFDPNGVRDVDPTNDTTNRMVTIVDTIPTLSYFPYCVSFENWETFHWASMNAVNFSGEHSSFTLGTPNKSQINTAGNYSNSWIVGGLDSSYLPYDSSGLFTPIFDVVNDGGCYQIGFSNAFKTELGHDGGIVEYSLDRGATWNVLGAAFEPQWYSFPYATALGGLTGTQSFSGTGPSWQVAQHLIQFQQNGKVNFRFRFAADSLVQSDGWAIDGFCFAKLPAPCYVGVSEIGDYGVILDQNVPNPANNSTFVNYKLPGAGRVVFVIRNTLGQVIYSHEAEEQGGDHRLDIGLDGIADGLYSYTLIYNDKAVLTRNMTVVH